VTREDTPTGIRDVVERYRRSALIVSKIVSQAERMPHNLDHILGRFHDLRVEIEKAALQDVRFRALCEDYGVAVEAFEFWSMSADSRGPTMINEYRRLLVELETEILVEVQNRR